VSIAIALDREITNVRYALACRDVIKNETKLEMGLKLNTSWEGRFTPAGLIKSYIEVLLARPAGVNRPSQLALVLEDPLTVIGHLLTLVVVLILLSTSALAVRRERLIDTWRPTHYTVSITLNSQLSEITTAQTSIDIIAIRQLSVIDLDFGDMQADLVTLNGSKVSFTHRNGKLEVTLPQSVSVGTKLNLTVTYHGKPKDGLMFAPDKDGKPTVVGDNWPDRVHHWIPSLDHPSAKATITFNVTAPNENLVVANGRLVKSVRTEGGMRTWTYTEGSPIPPYCMIIGVGDFFSQSLEKSGPTSLVYYVPHSDRDYASKGFAPSVPAVQLFSQTVGPFPYDKLALVVGATRFGGMENSGAIVFGSTLFTPNPSAKLSIAFGIPTGTEGVIAHEIAHQWFGDSVTESTWADLWLSEGFATYFTGLFVQKYDGEQSFRQYMKDAAEKVLAFETKSRLPIHDRDTEDLFKLLNANNYQKGAWVLHMLRTQLGDMAFFRAVRLYYQAHTHSIADTEDLRKAFEKASGRDLKPFFSRWIYESGHPQYQVSWKWLDKQRSVSVTVNQSQSGSAFMDPIPVVIETTGGSITTSITPTAKNSTHKLRVKAKPTRVQVDPQDTLLKEVRYK